MTSFAAYSPFFSSGLLAPHHAYRGPTTPRRHTTGLPEADDAYLESPCPSSPVTPNGRMDVDMLLESPESTSSMRRSVTPTPTHPHASQVYSAQQTMETQESQPILAPAATITSQTSTQPRPLRRRRSSLTQSTSPMNAIRSPQRSAGNALHLQRQLSNLPGLPISSSRPRSGSTGGDRYGTMGIGIATSQTSLVGRLRSGSVGCAKASSEVPALPSVRNRRITARRIHTMPIPAPPAPPPTAPLPALPAALPSSHSAHFSLASFFGSIAGPPSVYHHLRPTNLNLATNSVLNSNGIVRPMKSPTSPVLASATSARARGLSVSSSALDGDKNRIDEEMKEN